MEWMVVGRSIRSKSVEERADKNCLAHKIDCSTDRSGSEPTVGAGWTTGRPGAGQ